MVETSAITSSVTSASTDSQVPSAKAVYDALQEGGSSYTAGDGIDITNDVISVTGKADTSAVTTVASDLTALSGEVATNEEVTSRALNTLNDALSGKQDTLNIAQTTGSSSADVMSQSAVTNVINGKLSSVDFFETNWAGTGTTSLRKTIDNSTYNAYAFVASINQKPILSSNYQYVNQFSLVETSAITTSITSTSTDAQVPSAKAVYDQLGGLKLMQISQEDYEALTVKDPSTLYIILETN